MPELYLFSSFTQSIHLELAVTELEQIGLTRKNILAVPLDRRPQQLLFDTETRADGINLLDGPAALGTAGMVLGVIYGFVLPWGPIIWGIIGLFGGAAAGLGFDYIVHRRRTPSRSGSGAATVVLLVHCDRKQAATVADVLWRNHARGVGRLER